MIHPIDVKVLDIQSGVDDLTDDDVDSIRSDFSNTALEVLDNSQFVHIDTSNIVQNAFECSDFAFEKAQFNFWHDEGIVEIPVQCETSASWTLIKRLLFRKFN